MTVITRFPPSPTGLMHIGSARTALYNWLFAKHHGGKFLLRVEDTDRKRYDPAHVDAIFKAMEWLELDHDGDVVSQFENRDHHANIAQQLLDSGKAYHCYCTPEELEQMREQALKDGKPTFYDRRWRDKDSNEAPKDIQPVVRIKAPLTGETTIKDAVQGEITIKNETLDDFILLRSDGTPTYMLSVVVDDHDAGVTHIIRGDDHINNAFRQKLIFEAMDWTVPIYAHIPLILGPDGSKMSKRHGSTAVEDYKDMGYLPEAMRNYLLRLGWSHGDHEIISTDQAIEWFNLESVQKSPARFDFAKLENLNAHYIKNSDNERLLDLVTGILENKDLSVNEIGKERLLEGMDELKDRAKTLHQIADEGSFYIKSVPYDFDEKAQSMLAADILKALVTAFNTIDNFTADAVQQACKAVAKKHADGKLGKVGMPLRAALTGTTVSPSIFGAAAILGKEETLTRLNHALKSLG